MKTALVILAIAALTATWSLQKLAGARLAIEVGDRREQQRELASLRRENGRLAAMQPAAGELEPLRHAAAEHARLKALLSAQPMESGDRHRLSALGEWTPVAEWKNRGHATPQAAIETALWAAAGGDVSMLQSLMALDDVARQKAKALVDQLPPDMRERFGTVEGLIAAFTIRSIPLGEAQLVWFNQAAGDVATACVLLQKTAQPDEVPAPATTPPPTFTPRETELRAAIAKATTREEALRLAAALKDERALHPNREPPRAPDSPRSSGAYLTLRRDESGWRLVVPPSAVDRIAQDLIANPKT